MHLKTEGFVSFGDSITQGRPGRALRPDVRLGL